MSKKKPPVWFRILKFFIVAIGVLASVIGIVNIQNYHHPYWFGFIFGGSGLLVGALISSKLNPVIAANRRLKDESLSFDTCILFFGLFLLTASVINQGLSEVYKCDKFYVIDKHRKVGFGARSFSTNYLTVDIDGESRRIICDEKLWRGTILSIDLCLYNGRLGFGYISVKE